MTLALPHVDGVGEQPGMVVEALQHGHGAGGDLVDHPRVVTDGAGDQLGAVITGQSLPVPAAEHPEPGAGVEAGGTALEAENLAGTHAGQVGDGDVAGGAQVPGQGGRLCERDGTAPPGDGVELPGHRREQVGTVVDGQPAGLQEVAAVLYRSRCVTEETAWVRPRGAGPPV